MNAPHAALHTEANASHIRVTAKDDTRGLGATLSSQTGDGPPTGLDRFQNLLGRLNGKSEDKVGIEQQVRDGIRRRAYVNQRWGSLQFISAGFLVGEKPMLVSSPIDHVETLEICNKAGAKGDAERDTGTCSGWDKPGEAGAKGENEQNGTRTIRRQEKFQRRLERLKRRDTRKFQKEEKAQTQQQHPTTDRTSPLPERTSTVNARSGLEDRTDQKYLGSRHTAVRQRYIRQKKRAMVDAQALNEVGGIHPLHWIRSR